MFGFAAMLNWVKEWAGCRHVLTLLFVLCLLGAWCSTVSAQITIANPELTGFSPEEQEAIRRAVDYWNDIMLAPDPTLPPGVFNITFTADPATGVGGGWGGWSLVDGAYVGMIGVSAGTTWVTDPNTQLRSGTLNLESLVVHEIAHVMNLMPWGITVNDTGTQVTVTHGVMSETWGNWSSYLYTPDGQRLMDFPTGTTFTIDPSNPFTFRGTNAIEVWGNGGAGIPVIVESGQSFPIVGPGSTLIHPLTPFGNLNASYGAMTRPFLSEVELAIMQDLGHEIDRSRFFGRSFYQTHAGTITITDSDTPGGNGFLLDGMFGVGLHLVAGGNTIVVDTDITTIGWAGAGIRVENNDNTVVINRNRTVNASGENGIGVLITHTGAGAGTYRGALLNQGRIDATGPGGTGVFINNLSGDNPQARFDNSGIINAGPGNNAIHISTGRLGTWTTLPQMTGINLMQGTTIVGDIVSDGGAWQVLTFGRLAGPDGFAMFTGGTFHSDPDNFVIRVDGAIRGVYDMETWGGTTILEQDLTSPGGWLYIGRGTAHSTLVLRGDIDGLAHATVLGSGTLVAAGTEASGGTTFSLGWVRVHSGGTISPSVDEVGLGRLTIDGRFQMDAGSTLRVDLGPGGNSDRITVAPLGLTSATIGAINIDLTTLFAGTFTLVSADAGELDFSPASVAGTTVLASGNPITPFGRRTTTATVANVADTTLQLTVSPIINTGNTGNYRLTWTGAIDGTTWDVGTSTGPTTNTGTVNWRDASGFSVWFQDGDAVTFGLSGTNTINIVPAGGVVVGDMFVRGEGNWIFNGDISGVQTQITDIVDNSQALSTGGLTLESGRYSFTGTLTLNGINHFAGDITLDGGRRIVDDLVFSRTVINAGSELATAQNFRVGEAGFAVLNLTGGTSATATTPAIAGGQATAANNVFIGGNDGFLGIVAVGEHSTLTSANVHVGGSLAPSATGLPEPTGILAGSGTVQANVIVEGSGMLSPGSLTTSMFDALTIAANPWMSSLPASTFETLTIDGSLWMQDGSTLRVDLGIDANNETLSSNVNVIGTANIEAININLSSLVSDGTFLGYRVAGINHPRTYTLITSQSLIYTPNSATLWLNGETIPWHVRRWSVLDLSTQTQTTNTGTDLQLTIAGTFENFHLDWTGTENNLWDLASANWTGWNNANPAEEINHFAPGDAVTFRLGGARTINIIGERAVVADMVVSGYGNWTFTGGGILGDGTQSTLRDDVGNVLPGSLTIRGMSAVNLFNDTSTFVGGVLIESGLLQIGDGGTTGWLGDLGTLKMGDVENHGHIIFNRAHYGQYVNYNISGTGALTQRGAGYLLLAGNNTYTGLTTIESGGLFFGENTNEIGAVTVHSGTVFGGVSNATEITVAGTVNNNGGYVVNMGALSVTERMFNRGGTIAYVGDLTVAVALNNHHGNIFEIGNLQAGSVENLGQSAVIADVDRMSVTNDLENTGSIWSVTALSAHNVINSGNFIDIGAMSITNRLDNTGLIWDAGVVTANDIINAGVIRDVVRIRAGNNFINDGFVVNASQLDGNNSVVNRGYLVGIDQIRSDSFRNLGGTIAVGNFDLDRFFENREFVLNSVNTLTIDGNFESTSGIFVIGIDASNRDVGINVLGDAVINGGVIYVVYDHLNYRVGCRYVFITAENLQVNTALSVIIPNDPLFRATIGSDDEFRNEYWFTINRAFSYSGAGNTLNQRAIGRYLDEVGIFPDGDFRTVLLALDRVRWEEEAELDPERRNFIPSNDGGANPGDPLHVVLDQLSGSIHGTATTTSFQNTVMMHASLANVLRRDFNTINTINTFYGRSEPPSGNLWGMVYGHAGSSTHDGNIVGYRQGFSGIMAGFDRINERQLRLGLFLSMGQGSLSSELQDRALSQEFMLGHYLRRDNNLSYFLVQAGVGSHRYDTRRRIAFGHSYDLQDGSGGIGFTYFDRTARSQHSAFLATVHSEVGFRYRNNIANFSPFVGVQYTGLVREGFTERGAGSLNLTTDMEHYHSFRTMFGMRLDTVPFRARHGLVSFYGNVAWMYEFDAGKRRHTEFTARFTDVGQLTGPSFTVRGNDPGRDWVQAGFGMNFDVNANLRGFAGYDAYANQRQVLHSANLGFIFQR